MSILFIYSTYLEVYCILTNSLLSFLRCIFIQLYKVYSFTRFISVIKNTFLAYSCKNLFYIALTAKQLTREKRTVPLYV